MSSAAADGPSAAATAVRLSAASPGRLLAQGPLTFASARSAAELGAQVLRESPAAPMVIDCSGVSAADSAGLAVLLEWLGVARAAGRSLHYENLPKGLRSLAHISDVEDLLTRGV